MNLQLHSMISGQNILKTKIPMLIRPSTNPTIEGKVKRPVVQKDKKSVDMPKRINLKSRSVNDVVLTLPSGQLVVSRKPESRSINDVLLTLPTGQLVVSQLRIVSLALPLELGDIYPPDQLCWCTDQGRLCATGFWTYTPKNANETVKYSNPVTYSGNVFLPSTVVVAHVNAGLGRTPKGQPVITDVFCRIWLNISKKFFLSSNYLSRALLKEQQSKITPMIEEALEEYVCETVSTSLLFATPDVSKKIAEIVPIASDLQNTSAELTATVTCEQTFTSRCTRAFV